MIAKDTIVDFSIRGNSPYHEEYKVLGEFPLIDGGSKWLTLPIRTDLILLEDSIMPVFGKIETTHHTLEPLRNTQTTDSKTPFRLTLEHSSTQQISSRSSFKFLYFLGQLGGVVFCLVSICDVLLKSVIKPIIAANLVEDAFRKQSKTLRENARNGKPQYMPQEGSDEWIKLQHKQLYSAIQMRRGLKLRCLDVMLQYIP